MVRSPCSFVLKPFLIVTVCAQRRDSGWIHTLLEEAENERMHLMYVILSSRFEIVTNINFSTGRS